jgi:hypothetical protein
MLDNIRPEEVGSSFKEIKLGHLDEHLRHAKMKREPLPELMKADFETFAVGKLRLRTQMVKEIKEIGDIEPGSVLIDESLHWEDFRSTCWV